MKNCKEKMKPLAELEVELRRIVEANIGNPNRPVRFIKRAHRIVAELAKVDTDNIIKYPTMACGALLSLMSACDGIARNGTVKEKPNEEDGNVH